MGKQFVLRGKIDYEKGGAGNPGSTGIRESFTADTVEQAKVVARAILESNKKKIEERYSYVENMEVELVGEENVVWRAKLVPERKEIIKPAEERIIPEHFEEIDLKK